MQRLLQFNIKYQILIFSRLFFQLVHKFRNIECISYEYAKLLYDLIDIHVAERRYVF